jgi:hypothetical protein
MLHWNQPSKALDHLKRLCGVLVVLGGLYLT